SISLRSAGETDMRVSGLARGVGPGSRRGCRRVSASSAPPRGPIACRPGRVAVAQSSLFSENPGKRAAERWYLLYTPIWGAAAGVVMTTGLGVRWSQQPSGDLAFLLFGIGIWLGELLGGYAFRAPEDAARPWWRLYHTKFQIWMFVFAFLGNYFTQYFY